MGKSSAFRGVTLFRPTGKWRAQISVGGKTTSLGDHDLEDDAARTFDIATINRLGLSGKLNFPAVDYAPFLGIIASCTWHESVTMLRHRAKRVNAARRSRAAAAAAAIPAITTSLASDATVQLLPGSPTVSVSNEFPRPCSSCCAPDDGKDEHLPAPGPALDEPLLHPDDCEAARVSLGAAMRTSSSTESHPEVRARNFA